MAHEHFDLEIRPGTAATLRRQRSQFYTVFTQLYAILRNFLMILRNIYATFTQLLRNLYYAYTKLCVRNHSIFSTTQSHNFYNAMSIF
jgi:hypothetical protein